jgi:hypothetical protein
MIAVLPQTEHRHRNANGEAAAAQSQFESGCFIGDALVVSGAACNMTRRRSSGEIVGKLY